MEGVAEPGQLADRSAPGASFGFTVSKSRKLPTLYVICDALFIATEVLWSDLLDRMTLEFHFLVISFSIVS